MSSEGHGGFQVLITLALILVGLVYLRGWYRLRSARPKARTVGRLAAFMGGLFALWAVVASPLAALDHELLTFHMLQHLILMTAAAPMILLGILPISLRGPFLGRLSGWPPAQRLGRIGTHPLFCWLASTATVIGWHIPALFELGLHSEWRHDIEHASFFAAGLLFWWPVVQSWPSLAASPRWPVPLYLFLATLPCDALSAFLAFCGRVVYPHYLTANRPFGISALGDQECAGALMWVCVTFAYLVPAALVTIQMLSPRSLGVASELLSRGK